MAAVNPIHRLTEAEYLEIERRAEFKSEFFDGEMFALAGGSPRHSLIAANLIFALKLQLKGGPCRVYTSDLRLKVQASGLYTYPDVSVVCGQEQLEDEHEDVFLNPTVIFEILSDSREAYDRGRKFELYRGLASLREYVLVSQHKPLIENYVRQDSGAWLLHETTGLKGKVILPLLGITLELTDVYSDIRFVPIRLHPT